MNIGPGGPPRLPSTEAERLDNAEKCCSHLRDADTMIKHRKFDQARSFLSHARQLDPTNPYVAALEERIRALEASPIPEPIKVMPKVPTQVPAQRVGMDPTAGAESLEKRLRQEIEAEYREKFMRELRKAELTAGAALEEERAKLERQRAALNGYHEKQISEMRKRVEKEYEQKLDAKIAAAENRLRMQSEAEQAMIENEMKVRLSQFYEQEKKNLVDRIGQEHQSRLEQERRAFQERERSLKADFEKRIVEVLGRREVLAHERSRQQLAAEQEKARSKMETEFQTKLASERAAMEEQVALLRKEFEEKSTNEQQKLKTAFEEELAAKIAEARKQETEDLQRKRAKFVKDIEAELQNKYYTLIAEERKRLQEEANAALETERKRLQKEQTNRVSDQTDRIQQLRSELRVEMERELVRRLEQISQQMEQKMELLGATIPASKEEALQMYRERLCRAYVSGVPTVEEAKKLMELKELLEISFDQHLSIEADVKLELYVRKVEEKILSGDIDLVRQGALDDLKKQFRITPDEAGRLEPYILSSFQRLASKGKVFVVDDDVVLLRTLNDELRSRGFQVVTCDSVEKALEILGTTSFDVILSDIKFPDTQLDGFKFFEAVQQQPHLRRLPFVLMSSLTDGVIVRSGVQLGIDDYITKPLDMDMVAAVLEGKLKRYRRFERT
jgi:CheY-like chemotaxis protein